MSNVQWLSKVPERCDICDVDIVDIFVDGSTIYGPWANMCQSCHIRIGRGLGTDKGQKFQKQSDGSFVKVEG